MTKYRVKLTAQFKRDYRLAMKQRRDVARLDRAISLLADGGALPEAYRNHPLSGGWRGFRECHIAPDWLLSTGSNRTYWC